MRVKKDLVGKRFGMLTVKEYVGTNKSSNRIWKCVCDCGNECTRGEQNLVRNTISSCGCYRNSFLTPGDSARMSKAGKASASKRIKDHCDIAMILREKPIITNTSGHQGISYAYNVNKWHCYVGYKGYRANLGYFEDIDDAIIMHNMALEQIKNGTFEDFFYEVRGFRLEDKLQQKLKISC